MMLPKFFPIIESLGMTNNELLFSLFSLAVLSLLTVIARWGLIYAFRSFGNESQHIGKSSQVPGQRRQKIYGWIGVVLALVGFYLPVILFIYFVQYQDSILNNPEMDDWEQGNGLLYLRYCERSVIICQVIAMGFGVLSRRTVLGPVVLVMGSAIIYGISHHWLEDWYIVYTHF